MRNYIARVLALTSLAACTNAPAKEPAASTPPAPPTVSVPAIDVNELDSLIQRVVADKRLVGLNVGVMQDGKVVLARGYGFRSLEPKLPVTPTTMFGIGSVTKQFTCSSALLLEQERKLSMSDRVAKYFPAATRANDVTLLDLGQHVSGYRDYYPLDFVVREMAKPEPTDTVIARYATRPLDFEPIPSAQFSNAAAQLQCSAFRFQLVPYAIAYLLEGLHFCCNSFVNPNQMRTVSGT